MKKWATLAIVSVLGSACSGSGWNDANGDMSSIDESRPSSGKRGKRGGHGSASSDGDGNESTVNTQQPGGSPPGSGGPGCGGDPNQVSTPTTRYCQASCSQAMSCGTADSSCYARCNVEYQDFRAEYLEGMTKCYGSLTCREDNSRCVEATAQSIDPSYKSSPMISTCLARRDSCKKNIPNKDCYELGFLRQEALNEANRCFCLPCDQVGPCLERAKTLPIPQGTPPTPPNK